MSSSTDPATTSADRTIYSERLWVPWWYWAIGAAGAVVCTAQIAFNRSVIWLVVGGVIVVATSVWILITMSKTRVAVTEDATGERWLHAGDAMLPASVVSRSLAVPASAQRAALGRQLDPAAFLVTRGWVKTMVLLVLDDPDDPTPYWMVSTRNPEQVLDAFLGADRVSA
ncbi:DUF3093 domain-containing protein [Corynebacterium sp.]|uniref:DUF3093 domain-containing protein n=1 Tax=Corynebacterium sp. TaxID=1720 RepID=UPI0026DBB02D|nr:DUF3093 domain-containing protein [Corynebacterium sp.]MDO4609500.1 DUF3093 domain-containing protein [Corynebacterium sp.]